jgi:hypothetical protein
MISLMALRRLQNGVTHGFLGATQTQNLLGFGTRNWATEELSGGVLRNKFPVTLDLEVRAS